MTAAAPPPTFSIAIPCRNEAANIVAIAGAVIAQMERVGETFELVFIDNASTDATVALARGLCAADPRIRLIVNTRNFGQMRSPVHGIFQTRGRAVIGMCADFQDPPELISALVERWRAGAYIVLGVRRSEKSSPLLSLFRSLSYELGRRIGEHPLIPNATGFGLYDRKVVDAIAALKEPEPFFRGMLVETGYPIETIAYDRPGRAGGRSNNDFFTLLDFALSGLAGSSKRLMRLPFLVAALAFAATGVTAIGALVEAGLGQGALRWLAATAIEGQFGLIFAFLGLIAEQLRLVSERTRGTPLVLEQERVNFTVGE